jgi:nucleoside-diphosphate-sugar epimerase
VIVGNGLLANAFAPYFGVSNSQETRQEAFEREHELLRRLLANDTTRLVYFGSCGVATAESDLTAYMRHKKRMESIVLTSRLGLVLRLPQVVGRTSNRHTLTNFLHDSITAGKHFTVWRHAERNLIDVDDIARIGAALAVEMTGSTRAISIAAEKSLPMVDIVNIFEHVLGKKANYSVVDKGASMSIDTSTIREISARLGISLGDGYVENVISKYYSPDRFPVDDSSVRLTSSATKATE